MVRAVLVVLVVHSLALLALSKRWPTCNEHEVEPNSTPATATLASSSLPAWPPPALCGDGNGWERDLWRVPLDYHSSWFLEGAAHFTLQAEGPCSMIVLSAQAPPFKPYALVGRWESATGSIQTGEVGVVYWWKGFDHLVLSVQARGPYRLTYW